MILFWNSSFENIRNNIHIRNLKVCYVCLFDDNLVDLEIEMIYHNQDSSDGLRSGDTSYDGRVLEYDFYLKNCTPNAYIFAKGLTFGGIKLWFAFRTRKFCFSAMNPSFMPFQMLLGPIFF